MNCCPMLSVTGGRIGFVHPVLDEPVVHTKRVVQSSDKPRDGECDGSRCIVAAEDERWSGSHA
jgi:hypothetical protein